MAKKAPADLTAYALRKIRREIKELQEAVRLLLAARHQARTPRR